MEGAEWVVRERVGAGGKKKNNLPWLTTMSKYYLTRSNWIKAIIQ
jgi:hypothetical protein